MKLTKIGLVIITLFAAKDAAAIEVFISGTTAMRDLLPLVMNKICQTTLPRSMYEAGPGISGTTGKLASNSATIAIEDPDRRAFKCHTHSATTNSTVATALGVNADKDLTVYMSSEIGDSTNGNGGPLDNFLGGSITGVAPLAPYLSPATKQATVNFIDTTNSCTSNGTDNILGATNGNNALGVPAKGYGFIGAAKYTCANQITGHASEIGVSELEPNFFDSPYLNLPSNVSGTFYTIPDEWVSYDVTVFSSTNTSRAFVSTYGILVQDNVPLSTVSSLTQDELGNILGGSLTNWQSVGGPNMPIKICTRPMGSGVRAVTNQLVSRTGCKFNSNGLGSGSEFVVLQVDSTTLYNNYRSGYSRYYKYGSYPQGGGIRENLTTKDLQTCMTDNQWATGELTTAGGGSVVNTGAIGFIALDSVPSIPSNPGYHFIAYNGKNPVDLTKVTDNVDGNADGVRKDIVAMGYPLYVESHIQINPNVSDPNKIAFFNYLVKHSGDLEFTTPFPGLMSLHTTLQYVTGRGDMFYTRHGDNCIFGDFD